MGAAPGSGIIYALDDPRDRMTHYIGKTGASLRERLAHHLASARNGGRSERDAWLRDLISAGLVPLAHVLSVLPAENLAEAERAAIAEYRAKGAPLVNATEGGEGSVSSLRPVMVRMDETEIERLRALTARVRGMASASVMRSALRIGLAALEEDPRRLVSVVSEAEAARVAGKE